MSQVATTQPNTARPTRPESPPHLDAPLRTMFGLLILWGSLGLIFWAHNISDNFIRLDGPGGATAVQTGTLPIDKLMLGCSANLPRYSPREAVAQMAKTLELSYDKANLERQLGEEPKSFEIKGIPLFKAIHRLIDDRDVGYGIQGGEIFFYQQKLQFLPMDRSQINWEAELELSDKPLSVFPSGDSDLWFTVQMIRDLEQNENPWHTMQVELWKGSERQNTARTGLDASGKAIISTSTRENISFQIERTAAAAGNRTPGRYHLIFSFQSFE